jgi:hypothetical protein
MVNRNQGRALNCDYLLTAHWLLLTPLLSAPRFPFQVSCSLSRSTYEVLFADPSRMLRNAD